jgi:5-formyltetrahydrofolate cyclo-ligase
MRSGVVELQKDATVPTEKRGLRREAASMRLLLSEAERRQRSRKILENLEQWPPFAQARVVGLFSSLPPEPDTTIISDLCSRRGQRLAYPRVLRDAGGVRIRLFEVSSRAELVEGYRGIREPFEQRPLDVADVDVLLVPGLLFDRRGYRLGLGGGCYDRLLGAGRPGWAIGLAFAVQLVERVPTEPHDARLDGVATDEGVLHRGQREELEQWKP